MANTSVIGLLRVLLTANTAEFDSAMRQSSSSMKAWSKDLKQIGTQATDVGSALTKAFTVPIAGVGLAVAKMAMDFESNFANVAKTVEGVSDKAGQLTVTGQALAKTFRDMSKEIPATTAELTTIAALGGQMGVPIQQLAHFTKNVAALGVAVDGISTEEAAAGLASIGNATGTGTTKIAEMASALVHLGNNSNATEAEILEFTKRLIGAGHAAGMTVPEVMAIGTAMANVGINAEAGGTAMSTVISKISKAVSEGGSAVEEFAKVAGKSAEEFSTVWKRSSAEGIDLFIKGLSSMRAKGVDLNLTMGELGTEGVRVASTLKLLSGAGDGVSKSIGLANEGFRTAKKHLEEAEKKYGTTANQLKLLWNRITDVGVTLGDALLPMIKATIRAVDSFLPLLDGLVKVFVSLPKEMQFAAVGFAALVAAAGPLIFLFGQMALAASTLTGAFTAKGIAARGAATSLGILRGALTALLGPIGLVGAAAIVATHALTGLIEKRAKANLDAETTAAKEHAIAMAIARGANAYINYTEAIKFNQEWNEKRLKGLEAVADETKRTTTATQSLTQKLDEQDAIVAKADAEIAQLSKTAKDKLAQAMKSGAFSIEDLRKATGLSEIALKRFQDGLKTTGTAAKAMAKDTDEAAAAAVRAFKLYHKAMEDLDHDLTIMVRQHMNEMGDAAKKVLSDATEATVVWIRAMSGGIPVVKGLGSEWKHVGEEVAIADEFFVKIREEAQKANEEFERQQQLLGQIGSGLAHLGDQAGGAFGSFLRDLANITSAMIRARDAARQIAQGGVGNTIAGGIAGVGAVAQATGQGSTATRVAGGAAAGAQIGMLAGPWGALAGAAIGAIVGYVRSLGHGRKAVEEFAKAHGGFDALQAKLATLGAEGAEMWKALTQGVGNNNPQQAQAVLQAVAKRMAELEALQAKFNQDLQGTLQGIQEWGGSVPAAMQPYLDQLREAGRLTNENIALLDQLAGDGEVDWQKMQAVAEKYGIEIGGLGQTFQDQRLHASWQELIDDADLLVRGGADVNAVLAGMKDEINAIVNESIKFGTDIPENMRPWIEKLIASGELLDASGNKITDIGQLKFGETLQTSLEMLTDKIQDLIDTLNGVPPAIDRIPRNVDIDVNVREKHSREGDGTGDEMGGFNSPVVATFARGSNGWRNFGGGTPAMLHGVEAVVRPGDMLPGLRDPAHVPINPHLQSITILQVDARELGRAVADVLPGELRRLGVRVRT